jgi:hypothetical protein
MFTLTCKKDADFVHFDLSKLSKSNILMFLIVFIDAKKWNINIFAKLDLYGKKLPPSRAVRYLTALLGKP